eukprot:SAG11_NODE_14263_length_619_cov_1.048077_1_plen_47_part_00
MHIFLKADLPYLPVLNLDLLNPVIVAGSTKLVNCYNYSTQTDFMYC